MHSKMAWVAKAANQPMRLESIDLGPLKTEDIEIAVENCGLCHSDLSVLTNEWGISQYPAILGHEVIGRITAMGANAKGLELGQRVGVGWNSCSCMHCKQCMSGSHHLCPQAQLTVVGHRGGFATHVRSHWAWAIPLPQRLNWHDAGPLLCGGITVFSPLVMYANPTDRVGIIGIGGLGHMAVKFAAAYGCDVTAFTSSESKFDEARGFGASQVVLSTDSAAIQKLDGSFDLLISTVNVSLDWDSMIGALAPNGRLHVVGAVLEPIPVAAFSLIRCYETGRGSFHPKAYLFDYADGSGRAVVGSCNLSRTGLVDGIEWTWTIMDSEVGQPMLELRQRFSELFESPFAKLLTPAWIDAYEVRRVPRLLGVLEVELPYGQAIEPRPVQLLALQELDRLRTDGERRALVIAATGLGKTYLAAFDSLPFRRVLFVAHRDELLRQARDAFTSVRPADSTGMVVGGSCDLDRNLVFASVQSLIGVLDRDPHALQGFDYVVIDEFHHAAAPTYLAFLEQLNPRFLLGLTATPYRGDNRDLYALCDGNVRGELLPNFHQRVHQGHDGKCQYTMGGSFPTFLPIPL